jgi:hypothetical protein
MIVAALIGAVVILLLVAFTLIALDRLRPWYLRAPTKRELERGYRRGRADLSATRAKGRR